MKGVWRAQAWPCHRPTRGLLESYVSQIARLAAWLSLCWGAQGSGEVSLASPQPALSSHFTAESRVPWSPGERLLYRREGKEMRRNLKTVRESEPTEPAVGVEAHQAL